MSKEKAKPRKLFDILSTKEEKAQIKAHQEHIDKINAKNNKKRKKPSISQRMKDLGVKYPLMIDLED